jgi:hypothetical protein
VRDYQGCAERGLTQAETARELGVSSTAVCIAAKRLGLTFVPSPRAHPENAKIRRGPHSAAHRAALAHGVREAWKRHDINGRRRVLNALSPEERADYVFLTKGGDSQAAALRRIGREDLINA